MNAPLPSAEKDAGLRERVAALADTLDREADGICPIGVYDKKDKAWRVAHVRRRVAEDLRTLLADTCPTPPVGRACGCRCHGGHIVPGCRQNRCEKCVLPPASGSSKGTP